MKIQAFLAESAENAERTGVRASWLKFLYVLCVLCENLVV
jgi:hypothetical protein